MPYYQLIRTQKVPVSIDEIWDFISSPANLKEITPKKMSFIIKSNTGSGKMYPGMIITYKVSPLLNIKLNWMTEITHIKDKDYFVDKQRIGPYAMWHHQHIIEAIQGGILMTDIVTYVPPFGFIGAIANKLFIKSQLEYIFDFRTSAINKKFGIWKD